MLIYNLEVSFNFHATFVDQRDYRCSLYSKSFFSLNCGYILRAPDNSNFFQFPLKVRVIGSRLYIFKLLNMYSQIIEKSLHNLAPRSRDFFFKTEVVIARTVIDSEASKL